MLTKKTKKVLTDDVINGLGLPADASDVRLRVGVHFSNVSWYEPVVATSKPADKTADKPAKKTKTKKTKPTRLPFAKDDETETSDD